MHSWSQPAQCPQCAQQAQCPHQREFPCDIITLGIPQPNFLAGKVFHHHKARKETPTDLGWCSCFMMGISIQSKFHHVTNYSGPFDTTNDACQLSVCVYFDVKISEQ